MRLNPQFILRKVAGETLLISIQDITAPQKLLVLNELGADIYSLLQKEYSPAQIRDELLLQYEVEPDILARDIDEFLSALTAYGALLEI